MYIGYLSRLHCPDVVDAIGNRHSQYQESIYLHLFLRHCPLQQSAGSSGHNAFEATHICGETGCGVGLPVGNGVGKGVG